MVLDLTGVIMKLDRATALWEDLHTVGRAGPLYPHVRLEREDGETVRWFVTDVESVSGWFPAVLGDCLHNYRSALDHLVAAVREADGLEENRKSQWPVTRNSTEWSRALKRDLDGVPGRVAEVIHGHQPDQFSEHPDLDALLWLSDLDNADKHRRLHTVVIAGKMLGTTNLSFMGDDLVWHREQLVLGTVVVSYPRGGSTEDPTRSVDLTAEVAVDEGGKRWRAGELAWVIDLRVRQAIEQVASAYEGVERRWFTGPLGPSGHPDEHTNTFDPTGRLMNEP